MVVNYIANTMTFGYSSTIGENVRHIMSKYNLTLHELLYMHMSAIFAQFYGGSNHIFQTDTKALTHLAHYLAHKTFHSESRKLSLYATSFSQVIINHNLSLHMYANGTHVYISLSQSNTLEYALNLSDFLTGILFWMKSNRLKLNPDKTDLILIGTNQQRNSVIIIII